MSKSEALEKSDKKFRARVWGDSKLNYGAPIPVYCRGCGEKIGEMKKIRTPREWKVRFQIFRCPHCKRPLEKAFGLKEPEKK